MVGRFGAWLGAFGFDGMVGCGGVVGWRDSFFRSVKLFVPCERKHFSQQLKKNTLEFKLFHLPSLSPPNVRTTFLMEADWCGLFHRTFSKIFAEDVETWRQSVPLQMD